MQVFSMNGKVLCLCGGQEHKDLKLPQFSFGKERDSKFLVYNKNESKNCSESYKDKAENKIIRQLYG